MADFVIWCIEGEIYSFDVVILLIVIHLRSLWGRKGAMCFAGCRDSYLMVFSMSLHLNRFLFLRPMAKALKT